MERPKRGSKKTQSKGRKAAATTEVPIDGRTSVKTLFQLVNQGKKAEIELKNRPQDEVEPVQAAIVNYKRIREKAMKAQRELEEAEALIEGIEVG